MKVLKSKEVCQNPSLWKFLPTPMAKGVILCFFVCFNFYGCIIIIIIGLHTKTFLPG